MRFLNTNDLERWADTVECKYHLPHVIRKLILSTIDNNTIKNISFPYGEDVQTGGFDGELNTESENVFVPLGESVWEFGTTTNKKGKADDDYDKRKQDTLGKNPANTTYININAKKYRDKNKWAEEKKADAFWKDVRYIDAVDIEQWLELAPTVELWLAEKLKKPTLGIYTIEEYWKRWSENESVKIIPEILLGDSRFKEIEAVKSFLSNTEKVLYIKSITTDEAVAFPIAVFQSNDLSNHNVVVIDNRESFNQFTQTEKPLIVIAKFKIDSIDLRGAVQRGHKVIIPISLSDETTLSEKIQLPIISRDAYEKGLEKMGIDSEQASILTKNSGRNISVLKRLLKFDDNTKPKYLDSVEIRDVVPMLLINRFSENLEGDREIIEKLSGKSSDEYIEFLKILATLEDSPVYYINGVWRLISPTDSWLYFAKYMTKQDFINFQEICLDVLSETLHKYTLPLENRGNIYQTSENRTKYSSKLREGLCETLNVISAFGENYGITSISNISLYTDNIVQKILEMDVVVWRSLSSNLKLLAEASPIVFLNNLERIIKDKSFTVFFEEEQGFLHTSNDLAPLLWCLDVIAWFPEHLMRVSVALCEIISMSPESFPTTNTPLSNLKSIYRPWYPQTNTNAEDRKKILENLIKKYPETLYDLLYKLIDSRFDTAFHISRPKWRLFSELREIHVTQREVYYMRSFCINNIIEMSKNNINRILNLINLLDNMEWDKMDEALLTIETGISFDETEKNKIYHKFRKFIGNHRSHPSAHWSLPTEILNKIEQVALKFKQEDNLLNDIYLFKDHYPTFIEGRQWEDYTKHDEEILSKRLLFVENVYDKYGISKILELALDTEHPYLYGNVLAISDKINEEDKFIVYKLVESTDKNHLSLVGAFIRTSENKTNLKTQTDILDKMLKLGLSTQGTVNFLNSLQGNINLWRFISDLNNNEVEKLYWQSQQGFLYTKSKEELFYALDKLEQHKKSITLLNTLGWGAYVHKTTLTSEEVLTALEKASLSDFEDTSHLDHHHFRNLLDFLYSKDDYDIERAAKVEMKFMFIFGGDSYGPKPRNLYKLMSQKPDEYFEVLSQVYLPDDDELRESELQKIKDNPEYNEILKMGWGIFNSFNLIPSLQEDGSLDGEVLKNWILEVRKLAEENHRIRVTDDCLGKLLAKYPINMRENTGFPSEIYDLIEQINTKEVKVAFEIQISNNLGFTSRGAFEGGDIERFRANYFNSLFEETKITHPNVSLIFKNLRDKYIHESKWEDENALLRSLE
ncbi:hypothetical protein [Chryseobacterium sp. JV274]|uniref:hypothetical protein n=1 Tax=Chryseobacterium sp. JV274 TaxID=1932669 RepID=UPI0015C22009|nr:hypothetical protein [Chryseobacterium sp. JV274]CAD0221526.1 conserved protein of unknown function [Chryseobacterium sp. JV274]